MNDELETLHGKLVEAREAKDWTLAVAILGRLAGLETDPIRRAEHYFASAKLHRDELGDLENAHELCESALDCYFVNDPPNIEAAMAPFEALEGMLVRRDEIKTLERSHRKMIRRATSFRELQADLFEKLAEIYTRLEQPESAAMANQEAQRLRSSP